MSTRAVRFYSSTEEIPLIGPGVRLASYAPVAGDGTTTTEHALVTVSAATQADLFSLLHRIERILRQAERYLQTGTGDPVYLGIKTDPVSGVEYRSLIHSGSVECKPTALAAELPARRLALDLTWKRDDWFEGPENEVPLSNSTGSDVLGGLTVWNPTPTITSSAVRFQALVNRIEDGNNLLACFLTGDTLRVSGSLANNGTLTVVDGGHTGYLITAEALIDEDPGMPVIITGGLNNHVELAAADLPGALPAPIRLEFTSQAAEPDTSIYAAIGGWHDVAAMPPRVSFATGAGVLTDTTCIDGKYWHATWNDMSPARLKSALLTSELLEAAGGEQFLALVRLRAKPATGDLWLKLQIEANASGPVLWSGPWVQATTASVLQELGPVRLPPFVSEPSAIDSAELYLYGKCYSAGAHALDLDGAFLLPVESFRRYAPLGTGGLGNGECLTDDSIAGCLYTTFLSGKRQTHVAYGSRLWVWPGRQQRMYVVVDGQTGMAEIGRSARVRVFYRERRRRL